MMNLNKNNFARISQHYSALLLIASISFVATASFATEAQMKCENAAKTLVFDLESMTNKGSLKIHYNRNDQGYVRSSQVTVDTNFPAKGDQTPEFGIVAIPLDNDIMKSSLCKRTIVTRADKSVCIDSESWDILRWQTYLFVGAKGKALIGGERGFLTTDVLPGVNKNGFLQEDMTCHFKGSIQFNDCYPKEADKIASVEVPCETF